jgi:hypothetical protein
LGRLFLEVVRDDYARNRALRLRDAHRAVDEMGTWAGLVAIAPRLGRSGGRQLLPPLT